MDYDDDDDEPRMVVDPQAMLESSILMASDDEDEDASNSLGFMPTSSEDVSAQMGDFLDESSMTSTGSMAANRCPVCSAYNPDREHLALHFMQELEEPLQGAISCSLCDYSGSDSSEVVLHQVASHGGLHLDQLLADEHLVRQKQDEFRSTASSVSGASSRRTSVLGSSCPICGQTLHKQHARDHVAWHFMDELRAEIAAGGDSSCCPDPGCNYTGDKAEAVARHLALFHCRLDRYLEDADLVDEKKRRAMAKPKKVSIGPTCMICGLREPSREHVSRHFMKELMEVVASLEDQLQCPSCSYRGEKTQNLARHIALVHSKLDELLADEALVAERIQEYANEPKKLAIGPNCPVCDQPLSKQHSRVHVIWHFMDELREIVGSFRDPQVCDVCEYTNTSVDKVAKHIALGHSKLDELLQDEDLVMAKRAKALATPKKVSLGPACPVCGVPDPPREHVARHFSEELAGHVSTLPDALSCQECSYRGEKPKNLGIHIALVHGMLDIYLADGNLVAEKQAKFMQQPRKQTIGPRCPICDMQFTKAQNRDHVSWHFMDELREYVQSFPDQSRCNQCNYASEKMDNLVKHVALGHSKLDELLLDDELVLIKRAKAMSKPKRVSIGPNCPVCNSREPAREHVARHFTDELMEVVAQYPDQHQCPDCEYRGDKPKTLAIHIALVHGKLDILLSDRNLVSMKQIKHFSKPQKMAIGPSCPVCDMPFTKGQNRDHVSWHYMEELRAIVQQFPDPFHCTQCPYSADNNEKMVKHVALGHSMLDELLKDEDLLVQKRMRALSKPKKVSVGPHCPICDMKEPPREHVSRHFGDELMEIVNNFPDPLSCTECNYASDKPKNVSIHIALVHNILDQFLSNDELVAEKRERFLNKPQKVSIGMACPICDQQFTKAPNRDHVSWHFMDELRDIVNSFADPNACPECPYTTDKIDNLVKHVALGHSKLDELLQDDDLVMAKREIAMSKPKKVAVGQSCPICEIPFSKAQNRDHISWHFMDELRDFARSMGSERECQLCNNYVTDKLDNLVKHYALGHSKLDEYLLDDDLVEAKRSLIKKKPKRMSFGPDCPICGQKGRDRDHIARHFMQELLDMVHSLPKRSQCNECSYKNSRPEYLAKHLALFHCKLDEFMMNEDLVEDKRQKANKTPKRSSMGDSCLVCGMGGPSREHVVRHFYPELSAMLEATDNPTQCFECSFKAEKTEYVARHLGTVHCKLEELLNDTELLAKKSEEYRGIRPGSATPGTPNEALPTKILPMRESVRKSARQREAEERREEEERRRTKRQGAVESREEEAKRRKLEEEAIKNQNAKLAASELLMNVNVKHEIKEESFDENDGMMMHHATGSILRNTLSASGKKKKNQHLKKEPAEHLPMSFATSNLMGDMKPHNPLLAGNNHTSNPLMAHSAAVSGRGRRNVRNGGVLAAATTTKNPLMAALPVQTSPAAKGHGKQHQQPQQQVTIKRATKAKWQIKKQEEDEDEMMPADDHHYIEEHEVEPDISHMMVPEISHSFGEDEDHEVHAGDLFEPQIILNGDQEEEEEDYGDVEEIEDDEELTMCDSCGRDLASSHDPVSNECLHEPCPQPNVIMRVCPVCDRSPLTSREHVARHFIEELSEVAEAFMDDARCPQCDYVTGDVTSMALHVALGHAQLEKLLADDDLVADKRTVFAATAGVAEGQGGQQNQRLPPLPRLQMRPDGGQKAQQQQTGTQVTCPVCDQGLNKQHSRDHMSWHFMDELRAMVLPQAGHFRCPSCTFKGDKIDAVCRHLALFHQKLDAFLSDESLVIAKRAKSMAKPKKVQIGSKCPVCDFANPPREHVSRHFMPELMEYVSTLPEDLQCAACPYRGEKPQNLAKHMALVHSLLDQLLQDEGMVAAKRNQAMAKPKKISIGDQCPICEQAITKRDSRVHVIWHFMDDLRDMVTLFPEPTVCPYCGYSNASSDKMAKHMALGHSKLDELLMDQELVAQKREIALAKPKKLTLGPSCPICDMVFTKGQNRDHVSWHFMDELRQLALSLDDPRACPQCPYTSDKVDNLVKHLALGHNRLDELLLNEDLVAQKREIALAKPKKINLGAACPVCDMPFTKGQNRDHVAWHFMDELREYANSFPDPLACIMCEYRSDKLDNLVKHLALGHSKLDELLMDESLVAEKRDKALRKPRRFQLGSACPVCDFPSPPREHVARHFMDELMEYVQSEMPDQVTCNECEYRGEKAENLARHIGLYHGKLDEYLHDDDFVAQKRAERQSRASERAADVPCVICDEPMSRSKIRDHTAKHFTSELNELVESTFADPSSCDLCDGAYSNAKRENVLRHVALTHSKLEELLADPDLIQTKRAEFLADGGSLVSGHLADDDADYSNDYEEASPAKPAKPAAATPKATPVATPTSEHNTRRRTRSTLADSSDGDYTPSKRSRR